MFESLTQKLGGVFDRLTRRGIIQEADIDSAMREVRVALLEADVALPVVRDFTAKVKDRALGETVLKSITPGQMIIKIVHDLLVELLGGTGQELDLNAPAPLAILMVGLQGSGKTTSTAKIACRLKEQRRKKVLMASLDTRRPAAQQQLAILGQQIAVPTLDIVAGQDPVAIARRAMDRARREGFDIVMLDTAGRLHIDAELMAEVAAVRDVAGPHETLLVADAMTGQDAVRIAESFHNDIGLTGIVLTRVDGDARGGAALSMRSVTGCPVKLMGIGEKLDALEDFHPDRIARRILGMGDVVSLVERAAQVIEEEDAAKMAAKMAKGEFDLNDFAQQLNQLRKMGGLSSLIDFLPGAGKIRQQLDKAKLDEKLLARQHAIIQSMTSIERSKPDVIKASRKIRIAKGSGTTVNEVNKLLKQHAEAARMMKQMKKMGKKGLMRQGLGSLLPR